MAAPEPHAGDRKVVIDAGAAIKLQRLERFGGELYTTGGVLREVKDENARALLKTLPCELRVREPTTQDVNFVKQFAKATGDLGFLSANDIELIALTVALQREAGGVLRDRPAALATSEGQSAPYEWAPARAGKPVEATSSAPCGAPVTQPAAVAAAPSASAASPDDASCAAPEPSAVADAAAPTREERLGAATDARPVSAADAAAPEAPSAAEEALGAVEDGTSREASVAAAERAAAAAEAEEQQDSWDEDGSSAGEWVTPDNAHRFGLNVEPAQDLKVTCATADYSVQNVLLQMGVTPLTFDGYAVKSVKLWGLVCRACFHFTRDTQKIFCPKCGHDTVVRVPIIVDEDGQPTVLNNGRRLRRKGTIYSVPKAQGGRQWRPIYAEDELLMGSRRREMKHLERVYDKERQQRDPFNEDNGARAWWQRGTTSTGKFLGRAAPKMEAGYGRRNPNANNFRHKNAKRH